MAFRKLKIFDLWWTWTVSVIFRTLRYRISQERCTLRVHVNRSPIKSCIWPFENSKYLTFSEYEQSVSYSDQERCNIESSCQQKSNKKLHMAFRKLKIFDLWWTRTVRFIFRTLRYKISRERCNIESSCQQKSNKKLHILNSNSHCHIQNSQRYTRQA